MTNAAYRISVELPNGAKFRASGEVADVRVDVDRFYALLIEVAGPTIKTDTVAPVTAPTNGNGNGHSNNGHGIAEVSEQTTLPIDGGLDRAMLDRLFARDKHGTVSLRALPSGENAATDAVLALIYGADRLSNEQQVSGSRLMKAATQSGLHQVDRIDRFLNPHIGQYVTAAGFKKGRRYGLTNPGIRRAEEILTTILG